MRVKTTINTVPIELDVAGDAPLVEVLREELGLTGTKVGCAAGECGACTVLIDGNAVNACLVPAAQIDGRSVLTVEGLAPAGELAVLQRKFIEAGAIQCGFCTPGLLMSATALLSRTKMPTRAQITEAIAGNLCRCTGYSAIVEAIEAAAAETAIESSFESPIGAHVDR